MDTIKSKVQGAYEPVVELENGQKVGLVTYVKDLTSETVGLPGDIVEGVYVNRALVASAVSTDEYQYDKDNLPPFLLNLPTLEELGYAPASYELQAILIVNARANQPAKNIEVRAITAAGEAVAGSIATGTSTAASVDVVLKSSPFAITPGSYAVDIRLLNPSAGHEVNYANIAFLLQVKKKAA